MSPSQRVELGDIDELAHGAVGLGGIEGDFALEAYGLDNQLGELTDGEFLTGAHIDVAVANLAQAGDIAATTGTVVAVNHSVSSHTIVHAGVFLYTNDVTEVYIQQYVHTGICHILAPEELAEGCAGAPEGYLIVLNTVLGQNAESVFSLRVES